jgi:hypothetical protein
MRGQVKFEKIPIYNKDHDIVGHKLRVEMPSGDVRIFQYSERVKNIKSFHTQKSANEKAIREYLVDKGEKETGKEYKPTSIKERDKDIEQSISENNKIKERSIHTYANQNRLVSSRKILDIDFQYVYIRVKVKVFYNGLYSYAYGNSDHLRNMYKEPPELHKNRRYIKGNVPDHLLKELIAQAIRRALYTVAGGYDVKYDLEYWEYVYKQRKRDGETGEY